MDASLPGDCRVRALVADDHRLFRLGLSALLGEHGIDVVADAENGADALRLAEEVRPDVVVMDLGMPVVNGVEATRRLIASNAKACVVVLTGSEGTDVLDALMAGARGYLLKDAGIDRIAEALHAAVRGETAIAPQVAGRLVERLRTLERAPVATRPGLEPPEFTLRESEVLRLVATGCDNQAIASSLYISPSTVKHHVTAILHKLGVDNRVQAAVAAVRLGAA